MVLADWRLKVQEIVEAIGISDSSLVLILNEHLGMRTTCKLGAAFAHNRPRMQLCDNFEGVFGVVQPQYGRFFALFHNGGRNIDSPQHTRDQAAVKTVGFSGQIGAEEDQGGFVSQ